MNKKTEARETPNSKESEMIVLGCMLKDEDSLNIASNALDIQDFYCSEHRIIFQELKASRKNDTHLIGNELKNKGKLKDIKDIINYLMGLSDYSGTSAHIEAYVDELKKISRQRQLAYLGQEITNRALNKEDPSKIIIELEEKIKQIEKNKNTKEKFPIRFLDQLDNNFLLTQPTEKQMLLEYADESGNRKGFLPKGIVSMLVGAGGVGKTHLLAQLAISVATGTPWLDTFNPTIHCGEGNKGNVFFGLGENQDDDIHRILYKASKKIREHQPDITKEDPIKEASKRLATFSFCGHQSAFIEDKKPSLYFRQLKMRLIELAPKDGWSLIILDPISRLMGADAETDNAAATQFIALLEELSIDLPGNPTILFAHHTNKAAMQMGSSQNQSSARGSSALTDGVRLQLNFAKDTTNDAITILKMTKSNFTPFVKDVQTEKEFDGFIKKYLVKIDEKQKTREPKKQANKNPSVYMSSLGVAGIEHD
jgi:replicative DNA helicase